jgi:FKBP-type peptidyl-prolyl cis-trans isomerase (trigger factor)
VLKKLTENAELPGFRKGFAPENMVIARFGNIKILEDAAQDALDSQYWSIITDHSIKAIGSPKVTITKIAENNPLGFKINTAVMPEINLGDYKSVTKKEVASAVEKAEDLKVEEKEIEEILLGLRKSKAEKDTPEEKLPVVDDAFAQSLGDFKTAVELREKIRENAVAEKKIRAREKVRLAILEALVQKAEIAVPEILVEGELMKMIAQFKDDIARAGLTYEAYLEHIKKTEADIRGEWKDSAVKRAKTQLILGKIAADETIVLDEELVKKEVDHIVSHHKDADRYRVRMYVESMMLNEKVLEFLEGQK